MAWEPYSHKREDHLHYLHVKLPRASMAQLERRLVVAKSERCARHSQLILW
jgi:hypothetical protein